MVGGGDQIRTVFRGGLFKKAVAQGACGILDGSAVCFRERTDAAPPGHKGDTVGFAPLTDQRFVPRRGVPQKMVIVGGDHGKPLPRA